MLRSLRNRFAESFPDQIITFRSVRGERRLHLTGAQRLLFATAAFGLVCYTIAITGIYSFNMINIGTLVERRAELSVDYEQRIRELVEERDSLSEDLSEVQITYSTLVDRIGTQQELIFDADRDNIELGYNVEKLRDQMIGAQSRLDSLNLQVEAQRTQIASLSTGESVGQNETLDTIASTLTATAQARDEARAEAERLRLALETNLAAQKSAAERRDIMLAQLEEAVDLSLSPMERTLQSTGLNVKDLLSTIKSNYSGTGGLAPVEAFEPFGESDEETSRLNTLKTNLEKVSLLSTAIQTLPLAIPLNTSYRVTSGFGYRRHPIYGGSRMHSGMDLAAPHGTPIYAPGDGVVVSAGWQSGYGNAIEIRHANGVETLYGHLSRIRVSNGDRVKLGDQIGDMGSTGQSTGSHLHYEVKVNGAATNPEPFMKASSYVR